MPGTLEFSEAVITLSDLVVAPYTLSTDTYGTPASMAVGQTLDIDWEFDTDPLVGYGKTYRYSSIARAAKLKFSGGGVDSNVIAIIAGTSNATSSTTPNQRRRMLFKAGSQMPYFGAIGVGLTDDGGLLLAGLQACKLGKYPKYTLDGKTNKFNMWESDGMAVAVPQGGIDYFLHVQALESLSDWTVPANGTDFKKFFTDFWGA